MTYEFCTFILALWRFQSFLGVTHDWPRRPTNVIQWASLKLWKAELALSDTMFGHAVQSSTDAVFSVEGPRLPDEFQPPLDRPFAIVGRSETASVILPDRTVSLRHLYLQQINGRIFVCDLQSANGTRIRGKKITDGWWQPGDILSIGPYDLAHRSQPTDTGDLPPSPTEFRPRDQNHPFYKSMPEAALELVDKRNKGSASHLWPINRVVTLLGRDSRCRISCEDESVSNVHCVFVLTPSGLWVIDLLSRNGVYVNGNRVDCALLTDGFEIQIGRYKLRSRIGSSSGSSRPKISPRDPETTSPGSRPDVAFLTKNNHIFPVQTKGNTIVVTPQGDLQEFLYHDFQQEYNIIVRAVTAGTFDHVVINFGDVPILSSIIIEAIAAFCRSARGKAALCSASVDMYAALDSMRLPTIWYHYANVEDAVTAVELEDKS